MVKKKVSLFVLLSVLIIFFGVSCKKKEKKEISVAAPPGKEIGGDLHVLGATPQGRTSFPHEAETVVVIFDQAMVLLQELPPGKGSSFLRFDPPFSGKFRWLGTKTLTFTPDKRFPLSTEIKVTIPAGTSSLQGYSLKKDYVWSFSTARPQLVRHYPQDKQKWLKPDTQVLLIFNQDINKEKAKEFISFLGVSEDQKEASLGFSLSHPSAQKLEEAEIDASPGETLLLEPQESLKPSFSYAVELKRGLPSEEGPLGLEKDILFGFETYGVFRFEGSKREERLAPTAPVNFLFSNQVIYKEFIKKIRFEPALEIPEYYSEYDHGNNSINLYLPLQAETEYTVWIAPELEDEFGNKLGREVKMKFTTAAYPPSFSMTAGHGVLEAYGEPKYPCYARNLEKIFLQAANIKKDDVLPLLTNPKVFWSNKKFPDRPGFFQVEKNLPLKMARNKSQVFPIDLQELLPDRFGLIFLQVDTGLKNEEGDEWGKYSKAFLQVTELGISGKFSPENNLIWVTELKTGRPVPGAEVEIRDNANTVKWKGKTDSEGKVQTPGWRALGMWAKDPWSKPEQWVFAIRGKDVAMSSSEWGTGISPYRFGIEYDWEPEPETFRGYIFSERGIYRAGEDVHIKGLIRKSEKGQWRLPEAKDVECEIQDPFQKSVLKNKVPVDEFGSFAFDFLSSEEASLGYYQIKASMPPKAKGEKPVTFYESFRIEAFQPAEFEVHLRTLRDSYIFGQDYEAEIRANYLFGGAMAGQKISWYVRRNRSFFTPPGHRDYIFGNELTWEESEEGEESRLLLSGEGTLDPEGKIKLHYPLVDEKATNSILVALEATVESPSRRSISNRIQTVIHRGDYYIGLRPQTSFLKKGEAMNVSVITVDPAGTPFPEKKIDIKLLKREWRSVKKAGVGGRFKWITEKEDTEVASFQTQTKNEPVTVTFQPDKSGIYFLQAAGTDSLKNKITTTTSFYVTGPDYVPWERRDDDMIELVADNENYRPGDTARVLVKSPFERAKALVTIERELILESRVVEIQGTSSQIEVPIRSEHIPNVFVSVLLIQGRTAPGSTDDKEDSGKPSFKLGYINLGVDPSEKRLSVEMAKDKKDYRPGDKVTLDFKVKDQKNMAVSASLAVAVVDVGVLNIIGYQTPDPFSRFYGQKALSVQTSETRLHVVGQREYGEKGEDVGGGGEAKLAAAPMSLSEVELRGDFKSTAYWNPSFLTDERGEARVTFELPDNLTTFRVMVIAQTKESQFGQNESAFRVSKALLLQPALPRFARVGDRFEAGVVVQNFSSKRGNVVLNLEAKGIRLLDEDQTRNFPLESGQGKGVLFAFEVEQPGKAWFAFRAKMGEETDGLEWTLPLKMPRPKETVALFDQTQESAEEKIVIPEKIYASESQVEIQAASTALAGLKGSVDYLTDYPYACLEQRVSSILPYILASRVIQDFKLSRLSPEESQKYVQKTIKEIAAFQKDNGGFGLWPDSIYDSPFLTCYAAFAMIKARDAGYVVDKSLIDRAASYLKDFLREKEKAAKYPFSLRSWKTTQAYALYILALLNQPEPAYVEKLFSLKDQLSIFGKTLLLKALHYSRGALQAKNTLLQELLNTIKVSPSQAHFEDDEGRACEWIYASNTRTTAYVLQTMMEIGSDHPLLPAIARWLVEKGKTGAWRSTQENFYVFYALNDFYRVVEKQKPDFEVAISLAGKMLLRQKFVRQIPQVVRNQALLSEFKRKEGLSLKVQKKGEGIVYYGARMTYAPAEKVEPRDEGLAVVKRIETLDGKPLDSIKAGSIVMVTIELAVPKESLYVVVDDPLPAGFEAVNPTFLTESEEQQRALEQVETRESGGWSGFYHIEMHDDRVLLFADCLTPGVHAHRYLARVLNFGQFVLPGTKAEEMYAPEVFGRSPEMTVKIIK